jgi:hypothetical protein
VRPRPLLAIGAVALGVWLLAGHHATHVPAMPSVPAQGTHATPAPTSTPTREREGARPVRNRAAERAARVFVLREIRRQHHRTHRMAPVVVRLVRVRGNQASALVRDGRLVYSVGARLERTRRGWRVVTLIR